MGDNALQEARKTLQQAFEAGWGALFPFCLDNTPEPITTGPWVRLTLLWGLSRQLDIGSTAPFEEQVGVIVLQIFLPPDTGTLAFYQAGDRMRTVFGRKTFVTGSGGKVTCFTPRPQKVGKVSITRSETSWEQYNIQVAFRIDEIFSS